jgi:hypothetical protein
MADFYLKSGSGVLEFVQSFAYSLGERMVIKRSDAGTNFATARKWVWECTTANTSAAAEPTWPASVTQDVTTVTSNTAIFTARKPGFSSGSTANWTFATIYADYADGAASNGDTVYISNNHNETQSAAYTPWNKDCLYLCVDDAVAPPTTLATTATITTTGNSNLTSTAGAEGYVYGVVLIGGSGASGTVVLRAGNAVHERCSFQLATTGVSSTIQIGPLVVDSTFKFAAAQQGFSGGGAPSRVSGGSLLSGGTSPSALVVSIGRPLVIESFDLTNANSAINLTSDIGGGTNLYVRNCKVPASWSGSAHSGTPGIGSWADLYNTDNAGTNYIIQRKTKYGSLNQETTLIRTGGASNGVTGISWKAVTLSTTVFSFKYLFTPEIVRWNDTTASPISATVEILHDSATAMTDDEIWLEVTYLSASGAPLGALITDARGFVAGVTNWNPLTAAAANQTASSATWTTTGMSNPNKQKLSVTFTPQLKGFIHAVVKVCKASKTVYICPKLEIS